MVNYNLSRQKKYENLQKQIFLDKNSLDGYAYTYIGSTNKTGKLLPVKQISYAQLSRDSVRI